MKKKKLNIDLPLYLAIGFGLLATTMILVKAFVGEMAFSEVINTRDIVISGVQASFGYAENGITAFKINYLSFIAYLLPLVTALALMLFNENKIFNCICIVLFLASGICAFLSILTVTNTIVKEIYTMYDFRLAIGSILSGIFSIIASLSLVFKLIKK